MKQILYDLTHRLDLGVIVTTGDADDPRVIFTNKAYSDFTGYLEEELLGQNPKILQGPKTDQTVIHHLKQCLKSKEFFVGQTFNYKKNQEPFFLKWCISYYTFQNKPYYYAVQKYFHDSIESDAPLSNADISSLCISYNNTLRSQLQNVNTAIDLLRVGEIQTEDRTLDEIKLRIEFLGTIAKLNNYLLGER